MICRVWCDDVSGCDGGSRTWSLAVDESHKVKPNKKGMKLEFPGAIVRRCEFEGRLCSNIDGDNGGCGRGHVV